MTPMNPAPADLRWFRRLSLAALLLCFGVVVLGAFVRLSDAGLGCPDWPGCYGHLGVPSASVHVDAANAAFPERPLEAPKAWKEMVHRYFASTLGFLILILAALSLRRAPGTPKLLPRLLLALVIFQGALGMWTVTLLLKPVIVTAHLLGGMTTLALLLCLWLKSRDSGQQGLGTGDSGLGKDPKLETRNSKRAAPPRGLRPLATLALIVLACQIFLGGWTSTNYAALACTDLPTCHGTWWPQMDFDEAFVLWRGLGVNYEYGVLDNPARTAIHVTHRLGAMVVSVVFLALSLTLLLRGRGRWRGYGVALLVALLVQVSIGVSIVLLHLPLPLATAHNAGAALLLLVTVALNYHAWQTADP